MVGNRNSMYINCISIYREISNLMLWHSKTHPDLFLGYFPYLIHKQYVHLSHVLKMKCNILYKDVAYFLSTLYLSLNLQTTIFLVDTKAAVNFSLSTSKNCSFVFTTCFLFIFYQKWLEHNSCHMNILSLAAK